MLIMVYSGYNIILMAKGYSSDRSVYKQIGEVVGNEFDGNIDFKELKKMNADVIGWLYLDGTIINYPVVQGKDNDKYLHTLFDGSSGGAGTLFADCYTKKPFKQFNTIIYGHHMKDHSMFWLLDKFTEKEYAEEHPRFELITPEGKYHLEVWACVNMASDSKLYTPNVEDKQAYIDMLRDNAYYTTDVKVKTSDRLVLLSTCSYEYVNARHVVVGKLVPWEEK